MMICPVSHTRNPHLNFSIIFGTNLERARCMELVSLMVSEQLSEHYTGLHSARDI